MPLVEKWRLPVSNPDGRYREFDSRGEYLDYLRGRRAQRMADRRFHEARERAFANIHDDIHRVSSWDDVAHLLTTHDRDFRLLMNDPEFSIIECTFAPAQRPHTETHWNLALKMKVDMMHPLLAKKREQAWLQRRDWLDMRDRFEERPTLYKIFQQLELTASGFSWSTRDYSVAATVEIAKRAFPEIAVMEIMKAPPRKVVMA